MNEDLEHLKLLSIFHYIIGGLGALFSLIPSIHVGLGVLMLVKGEELLPDAFEGAPEEFPVSSLEPIPETVGWIFVIVGSVLILLGLTLSVCIILAGRNLATHRGHTFCLVVAGFQCLWVPFGTILGVFTLVVLSRSSVRVLFGVDPPPANSTVTATPATYSDPSDNLPRTQV